MRTFLTPVWRRRAVAVPILVALVVAGCGGGSLDVPVVDGGAASDDGAVADLAGDGPATTSGVLTFDGEEMALTQVFCSGLDGGGQLSIDAIAENGYRVQVGENNTGRWAQIVEPNLMNIWNPRDVEIEVTQSGQSFSGGPFMWFPNQELPDVEASFAFDCP